MPVTHNMLREVVSDIPQTAAEVLDPRFLNPLLHHLGGGAPIVRIEQTEAIVAMASKLRLVVNFDNHPEHAFHLCIKGFFDCDIDSTAAHMTTLREAGFYGQIAPHIAMRSPVCVAIAHDDIYSKSLLVLTDLQHEGAHFYTALEPFSADQVAETLEQLASLHARDGLLKGRQWIPSRLQELVTRDGPFSWEAIQEHMRDGRGSCVPAPVLRADKLKKALELLAMRHKALPKTVLHGDCHPGNVYRSASGELTFTDWQLIQRGHWSLDVAYHIAACLPVKAAEQEETHLLKHYLGALRAFGGEAPSADKAQGQYHQALVYGFYHWAITSRVDPAITRETFLRLGTALARCDSYRLLGV